MGQSSLFVHVWTDDSTTRHIWCVARRRHSPSVAGQEHATAVPTTAAPSPRSTYLKRPPRLKL